MPKEKVIPSYLKEHAVDQNYSLYTPIDHAAWRFIMRISKEFFKKHAHEKYLEGLSATGITTEQIPKIEEMDALLGKFGWGAVAVRGFIPPTAFMEFQSLGILPICADMRTLEHLDYTPAPDIVHEAAGHAPIIADPNYAEYLKAYGEVAKNAIISKKDMDQYHAIRKLSDVKEDPKSSKAEIEQAELELQRATDAIQEPSEAALLARMNWWTVEYGLVGDLNQPKIYGAGLLSSVGESYECLKDKIRKIPLNADCVETSYDITEPQPQLFVTPDFDHLTEVLKEFSRTMAYKRGGKESLEKAVRAALPTTSVLDSGLQISGVLSHFKETPNAIPFYLQFKGPTQLSFNFAQLTGHGPGSHKEGFGSPIGPLRSVNSKEFLGSPQKISSAFLDSIGCQAGSPLSLVFESGVTVNGLFKKILEVEGRTLFISLDQCTVTHQDTLLFDPAWGVYDMACGTQVTSVFGGPADKEHYFKKIKELSSDKSQATPAPEKSNLTEENKKLNDWYQEVREIRSKLPEDFESRLEIILNKVSSSFPNDWLLKLEILEILCSTHTSPAWKTSLEQDLKNQIASRDPTISTLIKRGLELLH